MTFSESASVRREEGTSQPLLLLWGAKGALLHTEAAEQLFGKGGPGNFLRIINMTQGP